MIIDGVSKYKPGDVVIAKAWADVGDATTRTMKVRPWVIIGLNKDYFMESYYALPCTSKYDDEVFKVPLIGKGVNLDNFMPKREREGDEHGDTTYVCFNQMRKVDVNEIYNHMCNVDMKIVKSLTAKFIAYTFDRVGLIRELISMAESIGELDRFIKLAQEKQKDFDLVQHALTTPPPVKKDNIVVLPTKKEKTNTRQSVYGTPKFLRIMNEYNSGKRNGSECAKELGISPSTFSRLKDKYYIESATNKAIK